MLARPAHARPVPEPPSDRQSVSHRRARPCSPSSPERPPQQKRCRDRPRASGQRRRARMRACALLCVCAWLSRSVNRCRRLCGAASPASEQCGRQLPDASTNANEDPIFGNSVGEAAPRRSPPAAPRDAACCGIVAEAWADASGRVCNRPGVGRRWCDAARAAVEAPPGGNRQGNTPSDVGGAGPRGAAPAASAFARCCSV